jgi:hypothetical protein
MLRRIAWARTLLLLLGIAVTFSERVHGIEWIGRSGLVLIVLGFVLFFVRGAASDREPVQLRSPVGGRWIAVNSPADKVPSHGTHELGQTYAIDLVYTPDPSHERRIAWTPLARRPGKYPAFGQPIMAPADGVVVHASGWQRDHWSRDSWPALAYLLVEGMVFRSILSILTLSAGRFVIGNCVVLDIGDGVHAVFAHMRRGSVKVRKGDRVRAGDVLGEVGNSGNSSEPHLHFHLMDGPRPLTASGLPFAFEYEQDGERRVGVPGARRAFVAVQENASV